MVLAAPDPLLTPPPSSSLPKTPPGPPLPKFDPRMKRRDTTPYSLAAGLFLCPISYYTATTTISPFGSGRSGGLQDTGRVTECVFITAGPIIKLCAGGEVDSEGHVL